VPTLIAGRKLLLADDSLAIQKVIDLTFRDEGMEVAIVGNGGDALKKLRDFTPDVVLADVFMPGVDGYKLCKFIKQDERFRRIPVMLLIGSFEPFDQAEAERVGADDVVTKPFQSIRQLVSRVGSLLGRQDAEKKEAAKGFSTLGLDQDKAASVASETSAPDDQPNVRVFVEAPVMADADAASAEEHAPPDIELQTADTMKLEPIDDAVTKARAAGADTDDTIEVQVVEEREELEPAIVEYETMSSAPRQGMTYQSMPTEVAASFDESVLDLGDLDSFTSSSADEDFILDLDVETVTVSTFPAPGAPPQIAGESAAGTEPVETQGWMFSHGGQGNVEATHEHGPVEASNVNAGNLSPEVIDAISRRVVEQLSEKVVREIAWEVVPELSELLIKQRLNEQK
jgi:CheY-like chemotaxis protein